MARTIQFNDISHVEVGPHWTEEQLKITYKFVCKAGETYRPLHRGQITGRLKEGKPVVAEEALWLNRLYVEPKYCTAEDLYKLAIAIRKTKGQFILESKWYVRIQFLDGTDYRKTFDTEASARNWVNQVLGEFTHKLTV